MKNKQLNDRALRRLNLLEPRANDLRISFITEPDVSRVVDFGVDAPGGLRAGLELARICAGDLADVGLVPGSGKCFEDDGLAALPLVQFWTDDPLLACMGCQYGGWPLKADTLFGIGSGPMRLARGRESLLQQYGLLEREKHVVGVVECGQFPDLEMIRQVAKECEVETYDVTLCVAPTRSIAGGIQIVARSVEATMHKLFELDIDLSKVVSGFGTAPLPPVSADDLTAIGRTNDAILYGGQVTLWIDLADADIQQWGPNLPSNSSTEFGRPFAEIFSDSGGDFYALDPMLFSAAHISIISTASGNLHTFGKPRGDILRHSFFGSASSHA